MFFALVGLHVLRSCYACMARANPKPTLPFHASCVCVCVCADGGWYDGATTRRQAGELTEIKSSMPIKGCDCNASLIVMWSGRKAEVHQIDLDTGAFVCASACRGWVSERARHRHTDTQTDTQTHRQRETERHRDRLEVPESGWGVRQGDKDGYAVQNDRGAPLCHSGAAPLSFW